jgi:hypothetical protein
MTHRLQPMPEPRDVAPDEATTTARTGGLIDDARLYRLLHDLDVANDTHRAGRRLTGHPDDTAGAAANGVGTSRLDGDRLNPTED